MVEVLEQKHYLKDTEAFRKTVPFGAQYLTRVSISDLRPIREWNWEPANEDLGRIIEVTGTINGTTGTGPTIREDEIRDEM